MSGLSNDQIWGILPIGLFAIYLVTAIFYEYLCVISLIVSKMKTGHRKIMLTMVTGIILAHATSILIYAVIYWALIHFGLFADLSGNIIDHFPTYIYFSATTYSSLGVGDVFPTDALRFLAGMEAINGLILITWSAAFTYFSIQKMREAHGLQENYCKKCAEK